MRNVPRASGRFVAVILGFAMVSCSNPTPVPDRTARSSDPAALGPGCDDQPDPHCNNAVSRVVVQMLRGAQLPIVEESKSELCRRMALDLVGRIPTPTESTFCATATAEQMATYFMGASEYIRAQGRSWGDHFYNLDEQWYPYITEIDDMVNKLFTDRTTYSTFMTQLVVHPGFYARFQGDDWSANVVRLALGRPARADEVDAMRPLQRIWASRRFCDGVIWYNSFTDDGSRMGADGNCGRTEWAVNYCNCNDNGTDLCHTNVFGAQVDFGGDGCLLPDASDDEHNFSRVTSAAAGRAAVCPGAASIPECADRRFADMGVGGGLSRLGAIGGSQLAGLYTLGTALAARPDFWEAAVDREMRRFLSWWQNGLRRPDFDIPTVRAVLADQLRRTNSIRQLQYTIVTSLLYTQPAELPEGTVAPLPTDPQPPIWSMGPTRVLTAERWLDSAATLTFGHDIGVCDYRLVSENYDWSRETDRRLILPPPGAAPSMDYSNRYHDWVEAVGGCSATLPRTVTSTLSVVSAQNFLAQKFCADGTTVVPTDWDGSDTSPANIDRGVTYLYQHAMSRVPTQAELDAARTDVQACFAADCNNDANVGMRWFCERLLDSAEFAIF